MRTLTFFAILLFSVSARAQYTEAMFHSLIEQYVADPVTFYKTQAAPGFRFIAGNGRIYDLEMIQGIYAKYRELPRKHSSLSVSSAGDLALATGTFVHYLVDRTSGDTLSSSVYFQYNLKKQGNKWQLLSAQHTDLIPPFKEDEPLLRAVIEKETAAFFRADFKGYQGFHSKGPYGSFVYRAGNYSGKEYEKALNEFWKNHKAAEAKVERSNWSFKVNRHSAYVTYTQTTTRPSGTTKSYEIRYLERENGAWRIVGVGVVQPN